LWILFQKVWKRSKLKIPWISERCSGHSRILEKVLTSLPEMSVTSDQILILASPPHVHFPGDLHTIWCLG
jgi:hypothetical protein